jgi:hypothetical protein
VAGVRGLLLAQTQIRSDIACPVAHDGSEITVLIAYSVEVVYFKDLVAELGHLYVEHAAVALALSSANSRVEHLEQALASNREIRSGDWDHHGPAFELIRQDSQNRNVKLHDLAPAIVASGDLLQP